MRDQSTQLPLFPAVPLSRHSGKPRTGQSFVCETCGTVFYRFAADIRKAERGNGAIRFCSVRCRDAPRQIGNVTLTCDWCGKETVRTPAQMRERTESGRKSIYCSAKCRDAANAIAQRSRVDVACHSCGKPLRVIPAKAKQTRVFCNRRCMSASVTEWATGSKRGLWGVRPDIGHFVRSSWEANVCRVLIALGVPYEYEPRTFRLSDGQTYRPDFLVANELWVEVKGWMDAKSRSKVETFRADHPDAPFVVVGRDDYKALELAFASAIPGWEYSGMTRRRSGADLVERRR